MANMFYMPFRPAYDGAGISIPGAQAYFTLAGTNTPSAPFSNAGLTTPRTNPVVADATGKFPTTYLSPAVTYRVRVYSKNAEAGVDTPLEEFDPYVPGFFADAAALQPVADAAAASATSASGDAGIAVAARDVTTAARDVTLAARDVTTAARDVTVIAEGVALVAQTGAQTARGGSETALAAVLSALAGTTLTNLTINAATRTILAGLGHSLGLPAHLTEPGREGLFVWDSSNLSAKVTADTAQGIYVAPSSDATGASGAWVRKSPVITPYHFGAAGDGVTNDKAALDAFNAIVFGATPRTEFADFTGKFGISGNVTLGPTGVPAASLKYHVGGDLRLVQLTTTFETLRIKNFTRQTWIGGIRVEGIGGGTFASRTCGVGIAFQNSSMSRFQWLHAALFWYTGIDSPTVNNDEIFIGLATVENCGSGNSGGSLLGTFTGASNTGSQNSTSQRTVLSGVASFPDPAITTYGALGSQAIQARIGGYLYYVTTFDSAAGTVTIYPWLDPNMGTAGTFDWAFGGGLYNRTADGNIFIVDHLIGTNCGRGLVVESPYGPRIGSTNFAGCGSCVVLGKSPSDTCVGTSISGYYTELNNLESIVILWAYTSNGSTSGGHSYINSVHELELNKCWAVGDPRSSSGVIKGGSFGESVGWSGLTLAHRGRILQFASRNIGTGADSPTSFFAEHRTAPSVSTRVLDSHTINLTVQGSGEFDRLFGYRGSNRRYVGTGVNGGPTGTFTFNPPTASVASPPIAAGLTSGSAVVKVPSTTGMATGMSVSGSGIQSATTISTVDSATQITLNKTATLTASLAITATGSTTTNASAIVTMPSTAMLLAGMPITGTGIPAATTISTVDSATQITLSAAATATGTPTLTVTGSINGTFAATAYSNFDGPADFSIQHTDIYQMVWLVRPVSGWIVPQTIQTSATTAAAPALSQRGLYVRLSSASAKTVTLPSDATTAFAIGDYVDWEQSGTGLMTFAAGSGATVLSRGGLLNAAGQYSVIRSRKVAANTWVLMGDRA